MVYFNAAILTVAIQSSLMISMLLRNILFARLLSPEDFGLAMTFGVVLLLFEYISNFGHENLMQRSPNGNRLAFQATVHSTLILRGCIVSILILLLSPSISSFLNISSNVFNYSILAIVPIINAFVHTDHQRLHRVHNYVATAKVSILADILSIGVALICVYIWNNYWAFYISFVFRHSVGTLFSHIWSVRPYLLRLKKVYLVELWQFGLPLIFVGVLKYFGGESDKALITRYFGLDIFSSYFLALMVVVGVTNFVSIGFSKIFIRRISVHTENIKQVQSSYENAQVLLFLILPLLALLMLIGEEVISLVFGTTYQVTYFLQPIICLLVLMRIINNWANQVTIASESTKLLLVSDVFKLTGLVCAFYVAQFSDVRLLCLAYCLGEFVYFFVLVRQLNREKEGFIFIALRILSIVIVTWISIAAIYIYTDSLGFYIKSISLLVVVMALLTLFYFKSSVCKKQIRSFTLQCLTAIKK